MKIFTCTIVKIKEDRCGWSKKRSSETNSRILSCREITRTIFETCIKKRKSLSLSFFLASHCWRPPVVDRTNLFASWREGEEVKASRSNPREERTWRFRIRRQCSQISRYPTPSSPERLSKTISLISAMEISRSLIPILYICKDQEKIHPENPPRKSFLDGWDHSNQGHHLHIQDPVIITSPGHSPLQLTPFRIVYSIITGAGAPTGHTQGEDKKFCPSADWNCHHPNIS